MNENMKPKPSEEYLVGKGRKPHLVIDVERHLSLSYGGSKNELFIGIFGKQYNIDNVIQNALSLYDSLNAYREQLCN